MSCFVFRSIALSTCATLAAGSFAPASAATIIIDGVFDTDDGSFGTFVNLDRSFTKVNGSTYFTLDFGDAPIYLASLSETGDALTSLFYVDTGFGLDVDAGFTPVDIDCLITPGGSCGDTVTIDGAFVTLDVSESNGLISGSQQVGGFFNDCDPGSPAAVEGQICGVVDDNIYAALLRVDFLEGGFRYPYRLTISDEPIGAVPEPASWAMMLLGFAAVGGAMRRRRRVRVSYSGA